LSRKISLFYLKFFFRSEFLKVFKETLFSLFW